VNNPKQTACQCVAISIAPNCVNPSGHAVNDVVKNQSKIFLEDVIVVTATRQAYHGDFCPLETLQAQLSVDAKKLMNAGALDYYQALDLSAFVAGQSNFGGVWNSVAIRSLVADENVSSNALVNGFNAGRGFGGTPDLSGVESASEHDRC